MVKANVLYLCSRKMNIKERYEKFKQWQLHPFHYMNHNTEPARCANCGSEVEANFCPICGQKAGIGQVGWKSVQQSVAILWGLESRSLLFTLVQLLLRPGYLISDYINGRRQVSFPPVKMLFILAVVYGILNYCFGHPEPFGKPRGFMILFIKWVDKYPGWGVLFMVFTMIFPTLNIFRHAPRNGYQSLPEGFFVQVFMASIIMMISYLWVFWSWFGLLIIFYYVVAYKQLFGYSLWGTLWRTLACIYVGVSLFVFPFGIIDSCLNGYVEHTVDLILNVSLTVAILAITPFINRWSEKKRLSQAATESTSAELS